MIRHIIPLLFIPLAQASADETASSASSNPEVLLQEDFNTPLSRDWFWGLGTRDAKDGILRGFESGERRHGPVKLRRFHLKDAVITYDFRLEGKASFSSFPMNGTQERGHILNVVMSHDQIRVIAHFRKGESIDLIRESIELHDQEWHPVKITLKGETIVFDFNGQQWSANHPVVAEPRENFGFGGDSGGPDGEAAGALEFRNLRIMTGSAK